jgi:hypothetical protein
MSLSVTTFSAAFALKPLPMIVTTVVLGPLIGEMLVITTGDWGVLSSEQEVIMHILTKIRMTAFCRSTEDLKVFI